MRRSNSKEITTIVFDLGGVLIDWNPRYLFRKLFAGDEEKMEFFLREICHHSWNEQQDAGRSFLEATTQLSAQHPDWKPMIDAYFARWPEMLGGAIQGTVQTLEQLKHAGWPLYALTNWSAETFPHALERFDFLTWFDGIVVSGTEKMKKPDPRFYQVLFERYQLNPETCLFIDDVQNNIRTAQQLRMKTIHFTNPEDLSKTLHLNGVL